MSRLSLGDWAEMLRQHNLTDAEMHEEVYWAAISLALHGMKRKKTDDGVAPTTLTVSCEALGVELIVRRTAEKEGGWQ